MFASDRRVRHCWNLPGILRRSPRQGPGCGARTALHMCVESEPNVSPAGQKGPAEGDEQPAAGFGRRVLTLTGLGALGAVGPLGSASGAQQAMGHQAPASTHARHWMPPRAIRQTAALAVAMEAGCAQWASKGHARLTKLPEPGWAALCHGHGTAPNAPAIVGTLTPSRGSGWRAPSLQVQQPTLPAARARAFDGRSLITCHTTECRSGQVRYITRPKSRTMRVTRQLMLPPSTVT